MAVKFVVDTHALLWFFGGNPRLGSHAEKILQEESGELILPAIVLAEACWIVQAGKSNLSIGDLFSAIDANPRCSVFPLDRETIEHSLTISSIREMHDRLIVATTMILNKQGHTASLLTRDREIIASKLVPTIW